MTIGTRLMTWLRGELVGRDSFGNRYYRDKSQRKLQKAQEKAEKQNVKQARAQEKAGKQQERSEEEKAAAAAQRTQPPK